jgi:hypothetical protein
MLAQLRQSSCLWDRYYRHGIYLSLKIHGTEAQSGAFIVLFFNGPARPLYGSRSRLKHVLVAANASKVV